MWNIAGSGHRLDGARESEAITIVFQSSKVACSCNGKLLINLTGYEALKKAQPCKRMIMKRTSFFSKRNILITCLCGITFLSIHWSVDPTILRNGIWRATIDRPDGKQIVFNFETKDSAGKKIIYVINASDRLLVDSVETRGDSVFIEMPFFESAFKAKVTAEGNLQGLWVKKYGNITQTLPFNAQYKVEQRFNISSPPLANISGRWSAYFKRANNLTATITAEFKQEGSHITGTFLGATGDYRFLEGVVSGDSLKLSGFDGDNAFLFTAKVDNKNKISGGKFYSGAEKMEDWHAERNANAAIPDGYGKTKVKPGAGKLNFSFPDMDDGHPVSLNSNAYKDKVVVITLMGSWCANCMDETKFLSEYYDENHQKGFEVIGLAYERTADFASSQKALQGFKQRFKVKYPILITGVAVSDSLRTEKTLPQLEKITAFPTTIFLDKKGNIRKIHNGFDGPATGVHHTEFRKEFNEVVESLLAEK